MRADPGRLEQALRNLVDNAVRHGRGPIALSAQPRGDTVELHVRDRGPGFPPGFAADCLETIKRLIAKELDGLTVHTDLTAAQAAALPVPQEL